MNWIITFSVDEGRHYKFPNEKAANSAAFFMRSFMQKGILNESNFISDQFHTAN